MRKLWRAVGCARMVARGCGGNGACKGCEDLLRDRPSGGAAMTHNFIRIFLGGVQVAAGA